MTAAALEIYHVRRRPDGLTRVTARRPGEGIERSWLVPDARAEHSVLDDWAVFHDAVLGFLPNW